MQMCCKDKVKSVRSKKDSSLPPGYFSPWTPQQVLPHSLWASHIGKFLSVSLCIQWNTEKSRNKNCLATHLFPSDMEMGSGFNWLLHRGLLPLSGEQTVPVCRDRIWGWLILLCERLSWHEGKRVKMSFQCWTQGKGYCPSQVSFT